MPDLPLTSLTTAVPVAVAFFLACAGWALGTRLAPNLWPSTTPAVSKEPLLDMVLCLLALAGVVMLRDAYRSGYLLSADQVGWVRHIAWVLDNFMICSPIFAIVALRQQDSRTILLSTRGLPRKLLIGVVFGLVSMFGYLVLRGELGRWTEALGNVCTAEGCADLVLIFFGAVILAFLLVRLQWAVGRSALVIGAVALACFFVVVGRQEGHASGEIALLFAIVAPATAAVLWVIQRSGDVFWAALVYFFVNAAMRLG